MIEVHPATGRSDAVSAVLRPATNPDKACWCLTYRLDPAQLNDTSPGVREGAMRGLCDRSTAPGLVAYVDGKPAGWCGVGPRSEFHRLNHSRTIQRVDDVPVWSAICFVVKAAYRGQGVAGALLDGAIDFAGANGAPALEGYPVEGRVGGAFAFPGSITLFERAGFVRVAPTTSKSGGAIRWIMRLDIG